MSEHRFGGFFGQKWRLNPRSPRCLETAVALSEIARRDPSEFSRVFAEREQLCRVLLAFSENAEGLRGDCDPELRSWLATASDSELDHAAAALGASICDLRPGDAGLEVGIVKAARIAGLGDLLTTDEEIPG